MHFLPIVVLLRTACASVRSHDTFSQRQLQDVDSTRMYLPDPLRSETPLPFRGKTPAFRGKMNKEHNKRRLDMISGKRVQASMQGRQERRLLEGAACTARSDCGDNEYCMSCKKCKLYANSLSTTSQVWWSCHPCVTDEESFCENGRYCAIAKDPIEESCPAQFKGCHAHDQCKDDEYCYDCNACAELAQTHEWLKCDPCPTTLGGYCDKLHRCDQISDSIDGSCPRPAGCSAHSDCTEGSYCESCEKCDAYLAGLDERSRSAWSCYPCPTRNGGICELERFCRVANDGIDAKCPVSSACSKHSECGMDEYCMGCTKCETYRSSLADTSTWSCDPCPTDVGGVCEAVKFCSVAEDAIDGVCPSFYGCGRHEDCSTGSFCIKYDACMAELGAEQCGTRPENGGFCLRREYCTVSRSITGSCDTVLSGCSHHQHCRSGDFCTSWTQCQRLRGVGFCGEKPTNEGICLNLAHCQLGLHSPIDGSCPLQGSPTRPTLNMREVLKFDGQLNLATFHQAMNVWYDAEAADPKERLVLQLHDYGAQGKKLDDMEYFASYITVNGVLSEEWREPTLCPYVEMIVPHRGPYIYEARAAMSLAELDMGLHDCSCLSGDFEWSTPGVCPRGVKFSVSAPAKVHVLAFGDLNQFVVSTNSTLYTTEREVKAIGFYVDGDGCPPSNYDWKSTCESIKNDGHRIEGVEGKWCTVNEGGCSATVKYKLCWASGAIGFVLVAQQSSVDRADAILLAAGETNSSCGPLIPAVHIQGVDAEARAAFDAGTMEISIGPNVTLASPRPNHLPSSGGLRVFDSISRKWVQHFEVFGGIQYAETSEIRDVIFVCAADSSRNLNTLRTFDISPYVIEETSREYRCDVAHAEQILYGEYAVSTCKQICAMDMRCMAVNVNMDMVKSGNIVPCYGMRMPKPMNPQKVSFSALPSDEFHFQCYHKIAAESGPRLVEIVGAYAPKCRKGSNRDYHVVDFAREKRFYTTLIDPEDFNNQLYLYDTTDLSNWKLQEIVHANWEDADSGLGQVVASSKGDRHVITWHCSNVYCTGSFGHSAYILDTSEPDDRVTMENKIALPMNEGTFARDVGCNSNDLCIVTLNHDGLVLIDLAEQGGPAIVATHAESFNDDHIPVAVYRMFSGAQKIYPSKQDTNLFYVESSSLDWTTLMNGSSLTRAINFDAVYTVRIEPEYKRGGTSVVLVDPIVTIDFIIKQNWQSINRLLATSELDETGLQEIIIDSFATATREKASRFKVIHSKNMLDGTQSTFEILPNDGPSPLTIYTTLKHQLESNNSAIYNTRLSPLLFSTEMFHVVTPTEEVQYYTSPEIQSPAPEPIISYVYIGHRHVLYLSLLAGFVVVFCVIFGLLAWNKHQEVKKLRKEMKSQALLAPTRFSVANGQIDSGFVIGRPAGSTQPQKGDDTDINFNAWADDADGKDAPLADNILVVGEPVTNFPTNSGRRAF